MNRLARIAAGLAAGMSTLIPVAQAAACTWNPSVMINADSLRPRTEAQFAFERDMRRLCAEAHPTSTRFLRDVRNGRYEDYRIVRLSQAFEDGDFGCERDRGFAFQLLDALVPDPVPYDVGPYALTAVAARAEQNLPLISDDRYRDIIGLRWLLASEAYSLEQHGWSRADIERFVLRPNNWAFALAHFGMQAQVVKREGLPDWSYYGTNPDRDETVFRLLTDPASARFDRDLAVSVALASGEARFRTAAVTLLLDPQHGSPDITRALEVVAGRDADLRIHAAGLLLDPQLGDPGLEAAQSLLGWHSPYVHLVHPRHLAAANLWRDIARRLAASGDPREQARGEGILETGDPMFGAAALPEVAGGLIVLDHWPESLPAVSYRTAEFWADNYPARALRDEQGGLSGLGVLFGPDGGYRQVWVSRPSGSRALDDAAVRSAERYFRPRLTELRLGGFAGTSVLVPLVEIEWHLGATADRPVGARVGNGRIEVVVEPIVYQSDC